MMSIPCQTLRIKKLLCDNFKEEDEDKRWDEDKIPSHPQEKKFAFQVSDNWLDSSPTSLPYKETSFPLLKVHPKR